MLWHHFLWPFGRERTFPGLVYSGLFWRGGASNFLLKHVPEDVRRKNTCVMTWLGSISTRDCVFFIFHFIFHVFFQAHTAPYPYAMKVIISLYIILVFIRRSLTIFFNKENFIAESDASISALNGDSIRKTELMPFNQYLLVHFLPTNSTNMYTQEVKIHDPSRQKQNTKTNHHHLSFVCVSESLIVIVSSIQSSTLKLITTTTVSSGNRVIRRCRRCREGYCLTVKGIISYRRKKM